MSKFVQNILYAFEVCVYIYFMLFYHRTLLRRIWKLFSKKNCYWLNVLWEFSQNTAYTHLTRWARLTSSHLWNILLNIFNRNEILCTVNREPGRKKNIFMLNSFARMYISLWHIFYYIYTLKNRLHRIARVRASEM